MLNFLKKLQWLFLAGRYTKIHLFKTEEIHGFGVVSFKEKQGKALSQYYKDNETMMTYKADIILAKTLKELEKEFFGPKYVRKGTGTSINTSLFFNYLISFFSIKL